jgi:dipeptidyl aminopeptidase/acylaminoacyl peptidase
VFLPDGGHFLFTRTAPNGQTATYLTTLDGGQPKRIADGSVRGIVSIAGGGSYLVGVEAAGVVARPFALDSLTTTGPGITLAAGAVSVSVSPNGVLATNDASNRLRTIATWFDRTGASLGEVGEASFIDSLALSADGRTLIVGRNSTGKAGENNLWARDLATGTNTQVTFNGGNNGSAVLSPDARRIVYASSRAGAALPYSRATDGTGDEAPFFPYEHDAYPNDWSHDGRWVIYSMRKTGTAGDNDLWVVPIDGGRPGAPVAYLVAPARQQQAQFSPDGRFVAYGSDVSGTFEIYVQPFPDPSQGKWMVSNGGGSEPRWSRDGKELFYFSGQRLMAVPVSVAPTFSFGPAVALFEAPIPAGYTNDSHRWQVAPDGKRFLLLAPATRAQASPIDVLVNWPALLKKK